MRRDYLLEEFARDLAESRALCRAAVSKPDPMLRLVREVLAFPLAAAGQAGRELSLWRPGPADGWTDLLGDPTYPSRCPGTEALRAGLALLHSGPVYAPAMRQFVRLAMSLTRYFRVVDHVAASMEPIEFSPAVTAAFVKRSSRTYWTRRNPPGWTPELCNLVVDGAADVLAHWWSLWVTPPISGSFPESSDILCRIPGLGWGAAEHSVSVGGQP